MNNHKEAIQPIILLVTARLDYTLNGSGLIIAGWSVPHKLGGRERCKGRLVLSSLSILMEEKTHSACLLGKKAVWVTVRGDIA